MKKLLIVLAALFAFNAAHAQVYVGGLAGFDFAHNSEFDNTHFSLTLLPEVGYSFNDKFGVGAQLILDVAKPTTIGISPYARYTFAQLGPVSLFADAAFTYQFTTGEYSSSDWEVGIYPGLAIPVSDKISFVGHFGYLSYDSDKHFGIGAATGANVGIFFNL